MSGVITLLSSCNVSSFDAELIITFCSVLNK